MKRNAMLVAFSQKKKKLIVSGTQLFMLIISGAQHFIGHITMLNFGKRQLGVKVYKWIALALSISTDFWLRWLVHEAWQWDLHLVFPLPPKMSSSRSYSFSL